MTETDQELLHQPGPAVAQVQESSFGMKVNLESDDQGETEDEEVKRNCMMGVSGLRDSDFSDTDMDDEEENEEIIEEKQERNGGDNGANDDHMEEEDQGEHLVQFVSGGQMTKPEGILFRPTPIVPTLATHPEESEEDAFSSSESEEDEEW